MRMNLTNHFLVAMPGMKDPYFQNSVIYVCEHNEEGAMGLMINAPVDITVGNMLKQVDVQPVHPRLFEASLDRPVYNGGQSQKTVVLFYINRKITMNPAFK